MKVNQEAIFVYTERFRTFDRETLVRLSGEKNLSREALYALRAVLKSI